MTHFLTSSWLLILIDGGIVDQRDHSHVMSLVSGFGCQIAVSELELVAASGATDY